MEEKEKFKEVKIPLKRLKRVAEYYGIPLVVFFSDNKFARKTRNEYKSQLFLTKLEKLISQLEEIIEEFKTDIEVEKEKLTRRIK